MDQGVRPKFYPESEGVKEAMDTFLQRSVGSFGETVLARFVRARCFHYVSMFVCHCSEFVGNKFSAIIGSDCKRDVASHILEVDLGAVSVYFESISFTCLLEPV